MAKRSRHRKKPKHSSKVGLPPGSLVYVGEEKKDTIKISMITYDLHTYEELETTNLDDILHHYQPDKMTWINIDGIHNVDLINKIGKKFHIHPLLLEDILNSEHRPKMSYFNEHLLLILKRFDFDVASKEVNHEQISLFLSANLVITFQENEIDDFNEVRFELRESIGDLRTLGTDFLFYRLIDHTVDHYITEMETIYDHVDHLEEEMVLKPHEGLLSQIYDYKKEIIALRKLVWPLKEAVIKLERREIPLISKVTQFYLSDISEHLDLMDDMLETTRSQLTTLLDIYFSSISTKMNEVMKVLTMVSTIFIPLTFIAGIYGMNFTYMPELNWKIGYPFALLIMLSLSILMLLFFRKKKWL